MARNQRLADAIARRGLSVDQVAEATGHHPKTVGRWIAGTQNPYPTARWELSRELEVPEAVLFQGLPHSGASSDELVACYGSRAEMPVALVATLAHEARQRIDVCAYAATWLWDSVAGFVHLLVERSKQGVEVRVCLGDPDSEAVRVRGIEEGIGDAMSGRCRLAISYARPLLATSPSSLRLSGSTLYASIFRFDDDVLANFHLFGSPASASPVLHCQKRGPGGLVSSLQRSCDAVWDQASPVE